MKRIFFITVFLCISFLSHSQSALSTEFIKKHTNYFTIDNFKINGEGKKTWNRIIQESQFIVYGEIHGSKQTSILTKSLIPILKKVDFNHFAIEVGPNSAQKLTELSTPVDKTLSNLKAFNTKYTVVKGEDVAIPIPFFDNVSDAEFLQEARKNDMILWGLDQEFYYGSFFLMDELVTTVKNTPDYSHIMTLKNAAQVSIYKHLTAEAEGKTKAPYLQIIKEKSVLDFFNSFKKDNIKAQKIIDDLKISWDIYIHWRDDSHADRISYMRANFMNHYNAALKKEKLPKVLVKIGSLHASKMIALNAFDIGNLTEELAQSNNTISTSINSWQLFTKDPKTGEIINNMEKYKSFARYRSFTNLAKKDQWAIIDLKPIRESIEKGVIQLPQNGDYHKLRKLIYSYDYQLLLPVDPPSVPNRNNI